MKISKEQFLFLFSEEILFKGVCTEISFLVTGDADYEECWMGKMADPNGGEKDIYWYGLRTDGSIGYTYQSLDDMIWAKVFSGRTILELVEQCEWNSIDGSPFEEMLPYFIGYRSQKVMAFMLE